MTEFPISLGRGFPDAKLLLYDSEMKRVEDDTALSPRHASPASAPRKLDVIAEDTERMPLPMTRNGQAVTPEGVERMVGHELRVALPTMAKSGNASKPPPSRLLNELREALELPAGTRMLVMMEPEEKKKNYQPVRAG